MRWVEIAKYRRSSSHSFFANMEDDEVLDTGLFEEPEGFRPPPPPAHFATYKRTVDKKPQEIQLRLVGKSPLWGHLLWNAGKFTADYLDQHPELIQNKRCIELGAAAALPSLICGLNNPAKVVSTDYPDPDLLQNIQYNIDHCEGLNPKVVETRGFIWGNEKSSIYGEEDKQQITEDEKFDLIILLDLIFNHTEHLKLLKDCQELISKDGKVLVVFSPHRPHLLYKDLEFFETAKQFNFTSEQIDMVVWNPMFEEDEETAEVRSRVYSFFLTPNKQ